MDRLFPTSSQLIGAALCALVLLTAQAAWAETATPAVLAASCFSCHGPSGASTNAMPAIDKMSAGVLTAALKAFRGGEAQGTVMNRVAKGYTDDEIAAIGQYFAAQRR